MTDDRFKQLDAYKSAERARPVTRLYCDRTTDAETNIALCIPHKAMRRIKGHTIILLDEADAGECVDCRLLSFNSE